MSDHGDARAVPGEAPEEFGIGEPSADTAVAGGDTAEVVIRPPVVVVDRVALVGEVLGVENVGKDVLLLCADRGRSHGLVFDPVNDGEGAVGRFPAFLPR